MKAIVHRHHAVIDFLKQSRPRDDRFKVQNAPCRSIQGWNGTTATGVIVASSPPFLVTSVSVGIDYWPTWAFRCSRRQNLDAILGH